MGEKNLNRKRNKLHWLGSLSKTWDPLGSKELRMSKMVESLSTFTKVVIGKTVTNKIGQCVRTFIEIIAKEIKKEIYEKVLFKEKSKKKLCHDLSHILLIHHNSRCK